MAGEELAPLLGAPHEALDVGVRAGGAAAESRCCRICLEEERPAELIAPCRCAGTSRWVHRGCLDRWRAASEVRVAGCGEQRGGLEAHCGAMARRGAQLGPGLGWAGSGGEDGLEAPPSLFDWRRDSAGHVGVSIQVSSHPYRPDALSL